MKLNHSLDNYEIAPGTMVNCEPKPIHPIWQLISRRSFRVGADVHAVLHMASRHKLALSPNKSRLRMEARVLTPRGKMH